MHSPLDLWCCRPSCRPGRCTEGGRCRRPGSSRQHARRRREQRRLRPLAGLRCGILERRPIDCARVVTRARRPLVGLEQVQSAALRVDEDLPEVGLGDAYCRRLPFGRLLGRCRHARGAHAAIAGDSQPRRAARLPPGQRRWCIYCESSSLPFVLGDGLDIQVLHGCVLLAS